jgi:hypothetical protein
MVPKSFVKTGTTTVTGNQEGTTNIRVPPSSGSSQSTLETAQGDMAMAAYNGLIRDLARIPSSDREAQKAIVSEMERLRPALRGKMEELEPSIAQQRYEALTEKMRPTSNDFMRHYFGKQRDMLPK